MLTFSSVELMFLTTCDAQVILSKDAESPPDIFCFRAVNLPSLSFLCYVCPLLLPLHFFRLLDN